MILDKADHRLNLICSDFMDSLRNNTFFCCLLFFSLHLVSWAPGYYSLKTLSTSI